jgi:esterase/lipase superfamily enzyme
VYPLLMISNRSRQGDGLGDVIGPMRFFECRADEQPSVLSSWDDMTQAAFFRRVRTLASDFPALPDDQHEAQKHVSLFIHGYNVSWTDAVDRYAQIKRDLFDSADLGFPILFSWPSLGSVAGYLPDREEARDSGVPLIDLLVALHDALIGAQRTAESTSDPGKLCRAKISILAHSMGNYVIEKALAASAKKLNSPQLITLINQLVMVAADVDNDLFQRDKPQDSDGSLMANLCYRIACLYTGLDQVLGASAGLKHFGTRRLGRSGLADPHDVWDNVFDIDVSAMVSAMKNIHSAVFDSKAALGLVEKILRGVDRHHLLDTQSGMAA